MSSVLLTPELAGLLSERARTFSFAARFLPRDQRDATTVLYAFCRVVDDLVDEPADGVSPEETAARLAGWRSWIERGLPARGLPEPAPLAEALRRVVAAYALPASYLLGLVDGVASDLGAVRMASFAELRRYCVRVAGTVGLSMCHVLGCREPGALAAAVELGVAMQLTNVLRDLGADLRRGRVYLPADELARFGLTAEGLLELARSGGPPDERFGALMEFQVARARQYYAQGIGGVWMLPGRGRTAILVAARLYRAILDEVERGGFAVLHRRAATSPARKLREALHCLTLVALRPGAGTGAAVRPETLREALAWLER